ncbi:MAG: hypothetical protein JW938_02380 [Candidatus Omnitrophica bacterium]|nr:hypothetical protein [Candidatus Omnitrophota bacterium]
MHTHNKYCITLSIVACVFLLIGCGQGQTSSYGRAIENRSPVDTATILQDPHNFTGKTVTVQGEIIRECPAGGWFDLKSTNGAFYVDLHPSDFAIPQKVGKTVLVEGEIKVENNKPKMIGKGVEIQ